MNIREEFKDHVSKSAFKGELIVGKYGLVEIIDGVFDVWFISESPLTERKLTAITKKLPDKVDFHRLTGEGWFQTRDKEIILETLPVLGVKKRKQYSEETLQKMREQGKKAIKNIRRD